MLSIYHRMFPKDTDVTVWLHDDKLEVVGLGLRVPYSSLSGIENADEKKIKALRIVLLGLIGVLWKKQHITILRYTDESNEQHVSVLDYDSDIDKAQAMIYQKMVEHRLTRVEHCKAGLDETTSESSRAFELFHKERSRYKWLLKEKSD